MSLTNELSHFLKEKGIPVPELEVIEGKESRVDITVVIQDPQVVYDVHILDYLVNHLDTDTDVLDYTFTLSTDLDPVVQVFHYIVTDYMS